jgi:hypothetical protein
VCALSVKWVATISIKVGAPDPGRGPLDAGLGAFKAGQAKFGKLAEFAGLFAASAMNERWRGDQKLRQRVHLIVVFGPARKGDEFRAERRNEIRVRSNEDIACFENRNDRIETLILRLIRLV